MIFWPMLSFFFSSFFVASCFSDDGVTAVVSETARSSASAARVCASPGGEADLTASEALGLDVKFEMRDARVAISCFGGVCFAFCASKPGGGTAGPPTVPVDVAVEIQHTVSLAVSCSC